MLPYASGLPSLSLFPDIGSYIMCLVCLSQTGHAMWPAVVVDESDVPAKRAMKPVRLDQSINVQFFGTHDFARYGSVKRLQFNYYFLPKNDPKVVCLPQD
jgi:hypothetical protein